MADNQTTIPEWLALSVQQVNRPGQHVPRLPDQFLGFGIPPLLLVHVPSFMALSGAACFALNALP